MAKAKAAGPSSEPESPIEELPGLSDQESLALAIFTGWAQAKIPLQKEPDYVAGVSFELAKAFYDALADRRQTSVDVPAVPTAGAVTAIPFAGAEASLPKE